MPLRRCQHLFVELDQEPRFREEGLSALETAVYRLHRS